MPNPIRVLPREIAEKIAAGEVVERPASVVKELVENALDAGAKNIKVELTEGGKHRILVADDGHGIIESEMTVALQRHATSKIAEVDDLWKLTTMGFRGEALPSIAAISRFTLESRTSTGAGRKLYLEGSQLKKDSVPTHAQTALFAKTGTAAIVEDLFFNVPARLKFLRSKSSEASAVRELLERIALCNPTVGFTLTSDGRKSLQLAACKSAAERVAQVFDTAVENLEPVESQFEGITVTGWLDRNERAANSRHVFLSVNGRMVRDKLLQQAVLVGLRPRMMEGEYPKIMLAVEVPTDSVDVNVHPAKSEVRFHKARDVFQVVHGALERIARQSSRAFYDVKISNAERSLPSPVPAETAPQSLFADTQVQYRSKSFSSFQFGGMETAFATTSEPQANPKPAPVPSEFDRLQYIGQLKNTYLLFQDVDGLVVIDQHAAHERVNYEEIKAKFLENGLNPQPLLVSAVVKCKAEDVALAIDYSDALARLGFEAEAFGDTALVLRSAPLGVDPDRVVELFKALLDDMKDQDTAELVSNPKIDPSRLSPKLERVFSTSACHKSVRAGQPLSPAEARELLRQMEATPASLNCPHGRPASMKLSFTQIESLFKR